MVRAGIPEDGRISRYYAVKMELLELVEELGEGAALRFVEAEERIETVLATPREALLIGFTRRRR